MRVPPEQGGWRLDKVLAARSDVGSRERARQALRSGKVTVAGTVVGLDQAGRTMPVGLEVEVEWSTPGSGRRLTAGREAMERAGVRVVHADDHLVVVDKPSGLLTDAADLDQARHQDTLRKRVRAFVAGEAWPVHRIDRDTTGLVLFARDRAVQAHLKAQWQTRSPLREYTAVVQEAVDGLEGTWEHHLAWDPAHKLTRPLPPDAPEAGPATLAVSRWWVSERLGLCTLVTVQLVTGKRNQIRVQAALAGHPLVGDMLYGDPARYYRVKLERQALHASRLGVVHPATGERVEWTAPLPQDLAGLVARLRAGGR